MTGLVADAGDEADLGSAAAWMGSGMRTARAGAEQKALTVAPGVRSIVGLVHRARSNAGTTP